MELGKGSLNWTRQEWPQRNWIRMTSKELGQSGLLVSVCVCVFMRVCACARELFHVFLSTQA